MADDVEQVARKAADSARKSAVLALVCVFVAIAILLVDNQIKRHIVAKAGEARQILDQFGAYAEQAVMNGGRPEASGSGDPAPGSGGAGDDVVGAPPGPADVDPHSPVIAPVPAKGGGGRAGGAGGPRGDG